MLERHIQDLHTDDPGLEEPAATRERLRAAFAPGATRRMTQLGLLVGASLGPLDPQEADAVVYASGFGESRALEAYLESFPFASPTLFQTSIHPSGVQQVLIGRQRSVRELLPMAGSDGLVGRALLAALTSPAARVLFCGGEERGTWLLDHGVASPRAFAFALALASTRDANSLGRITLAPIETTGAVTSAPAASLSLAAWFDLLHQRQSFTGVIVPGWQVSLSWS